MAISTSVSATYLYFSRGGEEFRWLRERESVAEIGYSPYVYDLRKDSVDSGEDQ